MAGPRALVVSIVAHGAVLAAISWWFAGRPEAAGRDVRVDEPILIEVVTAPPVPPPAASPMEVALLDGDGLTPPAPEAAAIVASSSGRTRPGSTVANPEIATDPGTANTPDPGRVSPLAMRGLRHDLTLSEDAARGVLADRPAVETPKPTGLIEPNGREGRIDDKVANFTVHGDGTVSIKDKKYIDLRWRIHLPSPARIKRAFREQGEDLAAWTEDPYRDRNVGKMQDLPRHIQAVPGACETYDDPTCDAVPTSKQQVHKSLSGDGAVIPVLGGGFDVTSYLHRKYVGDPYASRKLKILDSTRDERAERGAKFRAAQLDRSGEMMATNLAALWRTTTDPAARREALFELWDESTEGEDPAGVAGQRARAMVIGWIGAHLAQGQPGAFSADDIAAFDAKRTSKQHFAPY